jgi:hypothetical protein
MASKIAFGNLDNVAHDLVLRSACYSGMDPCSLANTNTHLRGMAKLDAMYSKGAEY